MNHENYGHNGLQPINQSMEIGDPNLTFEVNPTQPQIQQNLVQEQAGNW